MGSGTASGSGHGTTLPIIARLARVLEILPRQRSAELKAL
jgi:hypothetical protein